MADEKYASAQDFMDKMDRGDLEGGYSNFTKEVSKLTKEQLEEVAFILAKRSSRERK
jgi:hypothetical protein